MAYYEEVISLVVNNERMKSGLKDSLSIAQQHRRYLDQLMSVDIKFNTDGKALSDSLRNATSALDKFEADRIKSEQEFADIMAKHNSAQVKARTDEEIKIITASAQASAKAKENAARISAEIAQQFSRSATADANLNVRNAEQRFVEAERKKRQEIRETALAQRQAAQFNNIFTPKGMPLPIAASKINVSSGLRAAAGAAGAIGQYPAAGTLYASANAMQLLGMSTMTTASAMSVLGAASLVAIPIGTILAGKEFNEELAKMSTLLASATTPTYEFKEMLDATAQSAMKLSAEFNMGTTEVIRAFKDALSSGIEADELERFTRTAATLSTGLGVSLKDATNILTGFKDSYQLSIGELTKANDILFNTVNYGKVNVDELVQNFGRLLPIGKAAGLKIEDLAAGVAVLTRRGMTASQAVTSMTQVINGLVTPSDKAKKSLDAAGIATGDAAFASRSLLEVVEEIRAATGGSGELLGNLFTEERAKRGISSLQDAVRLLGDVRNGINEMGTASVASDRAMDTLWTNLGKKVTGLWNSIKGAGSDLSDLVNTAMFGSSDSRSADEVEIKSKVDKYTEYIKTLMEKGSSNPSFLATMTSNKFAESVTRDTGQGSITETIKPQADLINEAMKQAFAALKDDTQVILRVTNEELTKMDSTVNKLFGDLVKFKDPLEDMSKIQKREFADRATDDQKQMIDDLRLELELKQDILEEEVKAEKIRAEQRVSEYKKTEITPVRDKLDAAIADNNTAAIMKYRQQLQTAQVGLDEMIKGIETDVASSSLLAPMIDQINTLNSAIQRVNEQVSTQDTRKQRAADDRAAKAELEKNEKYVKQYNDIVESLYKSDMRNYEKVQKEKEQITKEYYAKIDKEAKKSFQLQADLMGDILQSQARQRGDDPSAQVRLGRTRRDEAEEKLKRIGAGGGSRDEFDSAVKEYREASELVRSAMSQIDEVRAERVFQDDTSKLLAINSEFDNNFKDNAALSKRNELNSIGSANVRSPQQLAEDASKAQAAQVQVEKVRLDAEINLTINGTLDEKSKQSIADAVVKKVQAMQRNKNVPTDYDTSSREDSRVTAE